jgi:DNA invertase Pin-like site-specific DNA recombinase
LNVLATITGKKAGFKSLGDTWADTTTSHGRLMLTVLGGLAEFERDLIRARTGEGRERAKAQGVKMGRKPKLTPHQRAEAIKRRAAGEPMRDIRQKLQRLAQHDFPAHSGEGVRSSYRRITLQSKPRLIGSQPAVLCSTRNATAWGNNRPVVLRSWDRMVLTRW